MRGQFSLFLPLPHVFIPGPFWPTFAEFMSWKDKGLRGRRGDEGRGEGVQVESSVMNAGKLRTKSRL